MASRRLCSIPGCGNPAHARGWCSSHWNRWYRYGDPLTPKNNNRDASRRFYTEVVLAYEGDDCLIWPYSRDAKNGYAQMGRGKSRWVSRMVCEHTNGPPPSSKHEVAHSCGRGHEGCVNHRHLRWATRKENHADKTRHGTWGKMTEETAREILGLKGLSSVNEISMRFGVHRGSVWKLFTGKTWKHLTSGQAPTRS